MHLDLFLARTEHSARGELQGRVFRIVAGLREELGLLEAIDQPADIRPVERARAHRAGLTGRDQRAGLQKLRGVGSGGASCEFGLSMMNGVSLIAQKQEDEGLEVTYKLITPKWAAYSGF